MTDKPYTEEQITEALDATNGPQRILRRVVIGLTAAVLAATTSTVILTVSVASQNHEARQAVGVADCRNLFDNKVADAREAKFDASMAIIREEGRVIIETAAAHPPAPFDPGPIFAAIGASDKAAADYVAALAERNDWVVAGAPLPCPIKPEGT